LITKTTLTFLPKHLSIVSVECISAHFLADGADGHVLPYDMADMAVLAILNSIWSAGAVQIKPPAK
jgi:hypothetical protein